MYLRVLQAIPRVGGPGQSPPPGGRADGADGDVHLHPGGGVVPPRGISLGAVPLPAVISEEGRAVVRGHADDAEAAELRREDGGRAPGRGPTGNLDRPAHRAPQSDGVRGLPAQDSRVIRDFTIDPTGQISPAGPLAVCSQPCETGTQNPSRTATSLYRLTNWSQNREFC